VSPPPDPKLARASMKAFTRLRCWKMVWALIEVPP
jgi:hypothetical protein